MNSAQERKWMNDKALCGSILLLTLVYLLHGNCLFDVLTTKETISFYAKSVSSQL